MTGLFSKILTQITGASHDAVDAVEDVGRTARQAVRDIENEIGKVEEAQVAVQAEYNLLVNKASKAQDNITLYQNYAKQAVVQSNEEMARAAIADRQAAEAELKTVQDQMAQFKPSLDNLTAKLHELHEKRDAMQRDTSLIESRQHVAQARSTAANILGGIGNGESATKTFDRLHDKVAREEAEADARQQILDSKTASDPSKKYASLNASTPSVDDELAALKAQVSK